MQPQNYIFLLLVSGMKNWILFPVIFLYRENGVEEEVFMGIKRRVLIKGL